MQIQDLPKVGESKYARVCESSSTTYLNEPNYKVELISNETNYVWPGPHSCKGWDCPYGAFSFENGNSKCGVAYGPDNPRHLIRLSVDFAKTLKYDTPCENYENAYAVNKPGQKGYVIGCPNGLTSYDASASISSATISPSTTSMPITSSLITSASAIASTSTSSLTSYITNIISDSNPNSSGSSFNSSPSSSSSNSSSSSLNSLSSDSLGYNPNSLEQTTFRSLLTKESHSTSDAPWPTNTPSGESSGEVYVSTPTSGLISSTSQEPKQSNEIVNLGKASAQLGAGAIVGIVFASVAGFTILAVLVGVAGFILLNLSSKTSAQEYSFLKTTRAAKV